GSMTPPQLGLSVSTRCGPMPLRQWYSSAKQPPGQRTFGTLIAFSAATTSLRMPRVFGIEEPGPTHMPSYTPWPRCSANWPKMLRSIFAPALDTSTVKSTFCGAAKGAVRGTMIKAKLRRSTRMINESFRPAPSMTSPEILVGCAGCGKAGGDLRSAVMRLGQCSSERNAGAGNLDASRVRRFERRRNGDCGTASAEGGGGDDHGFLVCAAIHGDRLAGAKADRAGHWDHGRAHIGGGADCGGARRAHRRDDGGLKVRACANHNRLASDKVRHAGDFDIGRTGG